MQTLGEIRMPDAPISRSMSAHAFMATGRETPDWAPMRLTRGLRSSRACLPLMPCPTARTISACSRLFFLMGTDVCTLFNQSKHACSIFHRPVPGQCSLQQPSRRHPPAWLPRYITGQFSVQQGRSCNGPQQTGIL